MKFFLSLMLFLISIVNVQAQSKHKINISLFSSYRSSFQFNKGNDIFFIDPTPDVTDKVESSSAWPVALKLHYNISKKLSVGINGAYSRQLVLFNSFTTSTNKLFYTKANRYSNLYLAPSLKYYLFTSKRIQTYCSSSYGYQFTNKRSFQINYKNASNGLPIGLEFIPQKLKLDLIDAVVGIGYKLNSRIGVVMELGHSVSWIKIGVSKDF